MGNQSAGSTVSVASVGGVLILDAWSARAFRIQLTENISQIKILNPADGKTLFLIFRQDATGGHTVTFPSNIVGGSSPTTTAGVTTVFPMVYDASDATWFVTAGAGGGTGTPGPPDFSVQINNGAGGFGGTNFIHNPDVSGQEMLGCPPGFGNDNIVFLVTNVAATSGASIATGSGLAVVGLFGGELILQANTVIRDNNNVLGNVGDVLTSNGISTGVTWNPAPGAPTEVSLTPSVPGNFSVAHGLGHTPRYVVIQMTSDGAIWFQTTRYDGTNINLTASDGGITGTALVFA